MGKRKEGKQPKKVYHTQQNLLSDFAIDDKSSLFNVLEFICSEANRLSNCAIYLGRQLWFNTPLRVHFWMSQEFPALSAR